MSRMLIRRTGAVAVAGLIVAAVMALPEGPAGWMWCSALAAPSLSANEGPSAGSAVIMRPASDHSLSALQCKDAPLVVAEGSNSCEIVSCGRGLKDTCKITCPADKTPKCSCDCLKSFGPMCTEYKANCTCE